MVPVTALAVFLVGSQVVQPNPIPTEPGFTSLLPAKLVSTMLARYVHANSMNGSIRLVLEAGPDKGEVLTQLAYIKPSLLYLRQTEGDEEWLVASDGNTFCYPTPKELISTSTRFYEPVLHAGQLQTVRDIFGAATLSIKDRGAPLAIAIGRLGDLQRLKWEWATLEDGGMRQENGQDVGRIIQGKWREGENEPVSGTFSMVIGPKYDLLEYRTDADITFLTEGMKGRTFHVSSVWTVNLVVDGPVDKSVFSVPPPTG